MGAPGPAHLVNPLAFLERMARARGRSIEDLRIARPVVLLHSMLDARLRSEGGRTCESIGHVGFPGLRSCNDVLLMPCRTGAPVAAIDVEGLCALQAPCVVGFGLAGSLDERIPVGAVVVGTAVVNETGVGVLYGHELGGVVGCDAGLAGRLSGFLRAHGLEPHEGAIWCTDAPYRESMEKVRRFAASGALCVEMESAGVVVAAGTWGVPAGFVCVISDVLSDRGWNPGFWDGRFAESCARLAKAVLSLDGNSLGCPPPIP